MMPIIYKDDDYEIVVNSNDSYDVYVKSWEKYHISGKLWVRLGEAPTIDSAMRTMDNHRKDFVKIS